MVISQHPPSDPPPNHPFAISFDLLEKHWSEFFSTTRKNGKEYKHIYIVKKESRWYLRVRRAGTEISLDQYAI